MKSSNTHSTWIKDQRPVAFDAQLSPAQQPAFSPLTSMFLHVVFFSFFSPFLTFLTRWQIFAVRSIVIWRARGLVSALTTIFLIKMWILQNNKWLYCSDWSNPSSPNLTLAASKLFRRSAYIATFIIERSRLLKLYVICYLWSSIENRLDALSHVAHGTSNNIKYFSSRRLLEALRALIPTNIRIAVGYKKSYVSPKIT